LYVAGSPFTPERVAVIDLTIEVLELVGNEIFVIVFGTDC